MMATLGHSENDADAQANSSEAQPNRLRLFIAINLPAATKSALTDSQKEMASRVAANSVRWARPPQLHLTLKFLGHLEESSVPELQSAIANACANTTAFALRAEGLGCFPGPKRPRVVWAGIEGDLLTLVALQKQIDLATTAWVPPEKRAFKAHLTLGRVTAPRKKTVETIGRAIARSKELTFGNWTVRQVDLMRSILSREGASYSCLASFELSR